MREQAGTKAKVRRRIRGFTLIELLVVLIVVGLATSMGAIGLAGQVTGMRVKSAGAQILRTLRNAREAAMNERRTWKVRFYQTRRATTVEDLFVEDNDAGAPGGWGTHQYVYSAPVHMWYQGPPSLYTPTHILPPGSASVPSFAAGVGAPIPLIRVINPATVPPNQIPFPTSFANLNLPDSYELPPNVRIVNVNDPTFASGMMFSSTLQPLYGNPPFRGAWPRLPNVNATTGQPPRPMPPPVYNGNDDRIVDVTYLPDGAYMFSPIAVGPVPGALTPNYTLTLSSLPAAPPRTSTTERFIVRVDYRTGIPAEQ